MFPFFKERFCKFFPLFKETHAPVCAQFCLWLVMRGIFAGNEVFGVFFVFLQSENIDFFWNGHYQKPPFRPWRRNHGHKA